jgi:hypothetical protein
MKLVGACGVDETGRLLGRGGVTRDKRRSLVSTFYFVPGPLADSGPNEGGGTR